MESLIEEITIATIFNISVVFSRLGSMLIAIPGIGETYVAARSRLLYALTLSIILTPVVLDFIPVMPKTISGLFIIILIEVIIGIFQGTIVRFLISASQVAGMIISMQSALGSALLFDPNQGTQGSIVGNFYTAILVTLFFSTNLDHYVIRGVVESFKVLQPGATFIDGDFTNVIIQTMSKSFAVAFKISSPIIIVTFLVIVGAGILSKLMPGMQVFFVITPVQILISFFTIFATLSAIFLWYINFMRDSLSNFFLGT